MDDERKDYGFIVKSEEVAEHIGMLMKNYFQAKITVKGANLKLDFYNGQIFAVEVREIK